MGLDELSSALVDLKNSVNTSIDGQDMLQPLIRLNGLLERSFTRESFRGHDSILEAAVCFWSRKWFRELPTDSETVKHFTKCALFGPYYEVFCNTVALLGNASLSSNCWLEASRLLETFFKEGYFIKLLQHEVLSNAGGSSSGSHQSDMMLSQVVVSLPDRIGNKLMLKSRPYFLPAHYFQMLGSNLSTVVEFIHDCIADKKEVTTSPVGKIFGKICLSGHSEYLYKTFLPNMKKWIHTSPLWSRVCLKIMTDVKSATEQVFTPLANGLLTIEELSTLLGDLILRDDKLKYVMTYKMLLLKQFPKDVVPISIFGYLYGSTGRKSLLIETIIKLFNVWSSKVSVKNSSFEQHWYLSRCIAIGLGFLNKDECQNIHQDLFPILMSGITAHLESTNVKIRQLGMALAELITQKLKPDGKTLDFEISDTKQFEYLSSLLSSTPSIAREYSIESSAKLNEEPIPADNSSASNGNNKAVADDLDSDDDLEPLNNEDSEDDEYLSFNGVRPPSYLHDCITGLLSSDDVNRLESCLKVAEKLIRQQTHPDLRITNEILKVLLHLQDADTISGFSSYRIGAMIAATTTFPKESSAFLIDQFYAENYSVRHRIDVLETLSKSARELSKLISQPRNSDKSIVCSQEKRNDESIDHKPDWRFVIEERLKSKTRYFSKSGIRRQNTMSPQKNRFSSVAGDFFFPLLSRFDRRVQSFHMMGDDCLLLGYFIETLGDIMHYGTGLTISPAMMTEFLAFSFRLRFHREAYIRRSLIRSMCLAFLSVNPSAILECYDYIEEYRLWLTDVHSDDSDEDCRDLAYKCYNILSSLVKEALNVT